MKKTRILFLGVVTSIALCSFLTSCDQVQVKQTETITIEKQRNQHLIMLSSAQAQDLNILILPEAYTKDEMGDFVADASKLYSVLRYTSPYYYLMDKINVWYAAGYYSESSELGSKKTAFGSGNPNDRTVSIEQDSVVKAVNLAGLDVEKTIVVMLVNTDAYVGYCTFYNGVRPTMAVCAAKDNYYATTIIHELGHAIGLLADEYDDGNAATSSNVSYLQERHKEGLYLNVASSTENIAWKDIMEDDAYASEETGIYVGGYYCSSGMYRSTKNSVMRSHQPNYNAMGRLRIYQQIMKHHTGSEPSYDQFRTEDLAHPAIEWDWKSANINRSTTTRAADTDYTDKPFSHSCIME